MAVDMLRGEPKLTNTFLNEPDDPPMLYAEEITEVKQLRKQHGLGFYSEDETNSDEGVYRVEIEPV